MAAKTATAAVSKPVVAPLSLAVTTEREAMEKRAVSASPLRVEVALFI
jgi:hypothetical protein